MTACDLNDIDRVEGDYPVPTMPSYCTTENSSPMCNVPLQGMDKEGSISNRNLSRLESYVQNSHSSVHCSVSFDCIPSNPLTFLRSLAKGFETPSIIREQVCQSSKQLLVESFKEEAANARDSGGVSDYLMRAKRAKSVLESLHAPQHGSNGQVDFNRSNHQNDDYFFCSSHEFLKQETSGAKNLS